MTNAQCNRQTHDSIMPTDNKKLSCCCDSRSYCEW